MVLKFEERTAGCEPYGRFGLDVAEYNRTYVLYDQDEGGNDNPVATSDVTAWITRIIGGTLPGPATGALGTPGGAGTMVRLMPMADPQFPSLFADVPALRVESMEGYDLDTYAAAALLAVPPTQAYARYKAVHYQVPFTGKPYAVLPNERMTFAQLDWVDSDNRDHVLRYAPEYARFTTLFVDDQDSRVSAAVAGGMKFRVPSGIPVKIDGTTFTGIPDMVIPDQKFTLVTYGLPARYFRSASSFMTRFKGRINYTTFLGCVPGSLLYLGARVLKTYTPPQFAAQSQDATLDGNFPGLLAGSFYAQPLVDVEFSFIFTARRRDPREAYPGAITVDNNAIPNVERPNRNWIDGPHNWLPVWFVRGFHYGHASDPASPNDFSKWTPYYLSFPTQILWMDPDVSGVDVTL